MPQKCNINICRDGAVSAQYVISATDNTGAGTYSCDVTIKFTSSSISAGYTVTAAGLFIHML